MNIEDRNKEFYTDKGLKSLEQRIKSLISLFNKNEFPYSNNIFGFGSLKIRSKEECEIRISELCDLIGGNIKKEIVEIETIDGLIEKETIIW